MYQMLLIVGNLGKDPEMRYMPNGKPVTNFNVAVNRKWTGGDGQVVKETTWFTVAAYDKQAETCAQWLKKGAAVLVEGRLTPDKASGGPRTFKRQDGSYGAKYELTANTVRFLSKAEAGAYEAAGDEGGSVQGTGEDNFAPHTKDIPVAVPGEFEEEIP